MILALPSTLAAFASGLIVGACLFVVVSIALTPLLAGKREPERDSPEDVLRDEPTPAERMRERAIHVEALSPSDVARHLGSPLTAGELARRERTLSAAGTLQRGRKLGKTGRPGPY